MIVESEAPKPKRPRVEEETRCRYLKFSNLPHGCTSDEVRALLESLGKVEEVQVARALGGGMVALVEMSCTREATSAKRRLNDLPLRGSELSVSFDNARSEQQQAQATSSQQQQTSSSSQPPLAQASGGSLGDLAASTGSFGPSSKLPPFYVPDRMARDVHDLRVIKMRSVLWTAREEDIRNFFRGIPLDRDAVEMGRDHAGRFSGMVYVRMRTASDLTLALRRQSEYLCGRQVILQRLDPGTPNIFRVGGEPGGRGATERREPSGRDDRDESAPAPSKPAVEPRPWPSAKVPASKAVGGEAVLPSGSSIAVKEALSAAPVHEAVAAVRQFLSKDPRLPASTRRAVAFLDDLRSQLQEDPACADSTVSRHLFVSPFEAAGVLAYSTAEVEHCFGPRSSDSIFWSIFQTYHTLLPSKTEESAAEDLSLEDFLAS